MQGNIILTCFALTLAAPAFAQDTTNSAQATDNATRSQVDNQSNSTRNDQQSSNDENVPEKNGMMSAQNKAGSMDFNSMDVKQRGYLMPADVASNKMLSSKFKGCDKNHDGRLSSEEYNACMGGM